MQTSFTHPSFWGRAAVLAGLLLAALPASAGTTTLTFDNLATEPGLTGDANPFSTANGGSNIISGVTFNTANNVNADSTTNPVSWEVIGNNFQATPGTNYGTSHSGDYYLAGNAYKGKDNLNQTYSGLTISTTQALESLWVGADDVLTGASSTADKVTITAYGAGGDLASLTTPLTNNTTVVNTLPSLTFLDTSATFGALSGVTGYRFEAEAVSLNATYGQAYVLADDMTFQNPVPEASTTVSFGLLLALGMGSVVIAARRKQQA
jgi:hypothetical protein